MPRAVAVLFLTLAVAACHSQGRPAPAPAPSQSDSTTAHDTTKTTTKPDSAPHDWTAGALAIGDAVIIVRARYGERVYVGAGDSTHTIALTFNADDVTQFVSDAKALLPPHPSSNAPTPVLNEPGSNRAMSFSRVHQGKGKTWSYHFYFADEALHGFPVPTTLTEARSILAALTRGAAISHEATPHP
jgi:hypothetical protein